MRWTYLLNLIIPGAGLLAIDAVGAGLLVAITFTLAANATIVATLLIPDDVPRVWRGLLIGITCGVYIGAQFRLAQSLRERRSAVDQQRRRNALQAVQAHLQAGELDAAWAAIESVRIWAETDLVVAYRRAQLLSVRGDAAAARRAWEHVRRLDRHRIYGQEVVRRLAESVWVSGEGESAEASGAGGCR